MADNHIINAEYNAQGFCRTRPVYQYDYGQVLRLEGFPEGMVPDTFEMQFAVGAAAVTMIGAGTDVDIPDACFQSADMVRAWLFLHDTESDGETKYLVKIPVVARLPTTNAEPTPVQQDAITQAIAALNTGVQAAEEAAERAGEAVEEIENAVATVEETRGYFGIE